MTKTFICNIRRIAQPESSRDKEYLTTQQEERQAPWQSQAGLQCKREMSSHMSHLDPPHIKTFALLATVHVFILWKPHKKKKVLVMDKTFHVSSPTKNWDMQDLCLECKGWHKALMLKLSLQLWGGRKHTGRREALKSNLPYRTSSTGQHSVHLPAGRMLPCHCQSPGSKSHWRRDTKSLRWSTGSSTHKIKHLPK